MRILFSAVPSPGHTLPLLPLAKAALARQHAVAFLSSSRLAALLEPIEVLPMPPIAEQFQESYRHTGQYPTQPGPGMVEFFAAVRIDMTYDMALAAARAFDPTLIVCDQFDLVAPMVAAALGIPWVAYGIMGPFARTLLDTFQQRWSESWPTRSLSVAPRLAFVDSFPDLLRAPDELPDADRMVIRPVTHDAPGACYQPPHFADATRPRVLLTLGTTVYEHVAVANALAASLADADLNVIVTEEAAADSTPDPRIQHVGFVPLTQALSGVDLLVSAGGTGTLLAGLSAGVPMLIRPFHADQPWNAARAERLCVSKTVMDLSEVGPLARAVLSDPKHRRSARQAAEVMAALPAPDAVLHALSTRCS